MRILLTNDDGIHAHGLFAAYQKLKKLGSVTVVAPAHQMSSVGHAITLSRPVFCDQVQIQDQINAYAVTGTPADCVKFALDQILKKKPDLVVSGINLGPNEGCSVFYSGTVAGAREGALCGVPAMAVSLNTFFKPNFSVAASYMLKAIKFLQANKLSKGSFLNVNVPNIRKSLIKGVRLTQQGLIPIHGVFSKRKHPFGEDYFWLSGKKSSSRKNNKMDTDALNNHYVTVTPIQADATDYQYLNSVNGYAWGK